MNNTPLFRFYNLLNHIILLQHSYMAKFIFITGTATLLPLFLGLLYIIVFDKAMDYILLLLMALALMAMINILLLRALLAPILVTAQQLDQYVNSNTAVNLPSDSKDDIGVLMGHVQYVTQKLELVTRRQNMDANLDPLTGILNRQAAEERLCQDIARAVRDNSKLLIALLDIDNFSHINDDFGRQMGDVCLTHIAEVLTNNIRKGDWVARWGGDKFLIVLWNFNNGEPKIVLQRIKHQSISTPMNELLHLNVNLGACAYQHDIDIDELITKLNACIQTAKHNQTGIELCEYLAN